MSRMNPAAPDSVDDIAAWAREFQATSEEARRRFATSVVLAVIASAPIGRSLAFKGGNALRFCHGSRRSTLDLDYSAESGLPDSGEHLRAALSEAVASAIRTHRLDLRVQSVRRNPRTTIATFPTYEVTVAFMLPEDRYFGREVPARVMISSVVHVEVSMNEAICEVTAAPVASGQHVRCSSVEDIAAEKLRSILQQPIRNRYRPQDVFDIAWILNKYPSLDIDRVSRFFMTKCRARNVPFSKAHFGAIVRGMAEADYQRLRAQCGGEFIEFELAWEAVLALVRRLYID